MQSISKFEQLRFYQWKRKLNLDTGSLDFWGFSAECVDFSGIFTRDSFEWIASVSNESYESQPMDYLD